MLIRIPGKKRTLFSEGQPLLAEDLQLVQDYLLEKMYQHNRLAFNEGVITGLTVSCSDTTLHITPGVAMDSHGRLLELGEPQSLPVPDETGRWGLYMGQDDVQADPWEEFYLQFKMDDPDKAEKPEDIKYRHSQEVMCFWLATNDDSLHSAHAVNAVMLATLSIQDGQVHIIDSNQD
jgi:hypothetical protein